MQESAVRSQIFSKTAWELGRRFPCCVARIQLCCQWAIRLHWDGSSRAVRITRL